MCGKKVFADLLVNLKKDTLLDVEGELLRKVSLAVRGNYDNVFVIEEIVEKKKLDQKD
jgi:hypothetical protein